MYENLFTKTCAVYAIRVGTDSVIFSQNSFRFAKFSWPAEITDEVRYGIP